MSFNYGSSLYRLALYGARPIDHKAWRVTRSSKRKKKVKK